MKECEYLFNYLLLHNYNFNKTLYEEYILPDYKVILKEKNGIISKEASKFIDKNFYVIEFESGKIYKNDFEKITGEVIEYEYFII